jgi:hypothetical protein
MIQTFWTKIRDSFYVALTAVLIVLLAILIVWFVIKVVPKAFSLFRNGVATTLDSVFVENEDITPIVNKKTISSGETFVIALGDSSNGDLYTFNYPCTDGVSFSVTSDPKASIECGKDFYLLNKTSDVSITGFSTNKRIVVVPIKIGLQKQDSQKIDNISEFKVTITNSSYTTPIEKNESTGNTNYTPTQTSNVIYLGKADLSVKIIDTGIIDKNTLQFRKNSIVSSSERVAVKFEVKNIGDRATGIWNFSASLPSVTSPSYQSDTQISLKPGDKIEFTLGFDNPINSSGLNNFSVNIDPQNYVNESNESNNSASIGIYTNGYNYNNNQNYNGSLTASCYSIPSNPSIGENVTWYATVTGGTGIYNYYWTGTDSLVGSSQSISKIYYTSGHKSANLIITSGAYTISRGCNLNVANYNNNYNNYGSSDLTVRLIGVGMLDSTGNFVYATNIPKDSNAAIKFEVTNNGTNNSGPWDVSATLSPAMSWYTFRSNNYPSIAPGQRTEVVVNFSGVNYLGDNIFFVTVDPNNLTTDTNRINNTLSSIIRIY